MSKLKYFLTLWVISAFVSACEKPKASDTTASNAPSGDGTTCYLLTEGTQNQDTTRATITIAGDQVSGSYEWLPSEKDAAIGTLKCTKTGDIIDGMYSYMIEGSNQTETVRFKLEGGKLWRYNSELEDKKMDGNLTFKDASKGEYKDALNAVPCK